MPNHIKFCSCESCRTGKHRSAFREARIRRAIKGHRREVKIALQKDKELPGPITVGYTD